MASAPRKAAAAGAAASIITSIFGFFLFLTLFGSPASSRKVARYEEVSGLAPATTDSFAAFIQQQAQTSVLPADILTEGRKAGLKLVRCKRVDLKGDWPVGRMAKITGSGWANSEAALRIAIWPDEPENLYDLETVEGMKRKFEEKQNRIEIDEKDAEANAAEEEPDTSEEIEPIVPEDDDEQIPDEPSQPRLKDVKEEWMVAAKDFSGEKHKVSFVSSSAEMREIHDHFRPETTQQVPSMVEKGGKKMGGGNETPFWKKSLKVLRRMKRQIRALRKMGKAAGVEVSYEEMAALLEQLDGSKVTKKRLLRIMARRRSREADPPEESITAAAKVFNRAKMHKNEGMVAKAKPAVLTLLRGLESMARSASPDTVKFATTLANEKMKYWRRKKKEGKSAMMSAFAEVDANFLGFARDVFDTLKDSAKGVIDALSAKIKNLFGKLKEEVERERAKNHVAALQVIDPSQSEDGVLVITAAIRGREPTAELISNLIKAAPASVNVVMPSKESIQVLVKLLPQGKAAGESTERSKALPAVQALSRALLPQKEKYLSAMGNSGEDGEVSAMSGGSGSDSDTPSPEENVKAQEEWKPIFGFKIERVSLSEEEVKEKVDAKMKPLESPEEGAKKEPNDELDAAKKIVREEQDKEVRVTGPFTCTTFVTERDGGQADKMKTNLPMISPDRGFMVVITRTLNGFEFDLFGWSTAGSRSSWKSVHVDNVPVESIASPRIVMADTDANVRSLRYYVSNDMGVDGFKCEKVIDNADCAVSKWTAWTPCTTSCGVGEIHRERLVVRDAIGNGRCDQPLTDVQLCNVDKPCSDTYQDCELSAWTAFSACSVTCGTGTKTRTREVLKQPTEKGLPCGKLTNTIPCHLAPCKE